MWRIVRIAIIVSIAIVAGIIGLFLANNYMATIEDIPTKGTIAAAAITLFGVIFSAMYKELSAYYQERSEIVCRKWNQIFPFIEKYYNAWINRAQSLRFSLMNIDPNKPTSLATTRVLYFTALFYEHRLRFIINGGGLILLSTNKENKKIINAYRQIEKDYKWAGEETPIDISYLQHLFIQKNKPDNPYVLYAFIEDIKTDKHLTESLKKLQSWLTKENIENLKGELENFSDVFSKAIGKLYSNWGN
jgi:hypothetical protein